VHRLTTAQWIDAFPDALIVADQAGVVVLANRRAEELFGFEPERLAGLRIEHLLPERLQAVHTEHRRLFHQAPQARPMGAGLDLSARRADGTEFPVEISLSPAETEDGTVVLCAVRDVTEQQRTRVRFQALLEAAPDAIVITDHDGRITLVNAQTERLFGHPRGTLLGRPVEALVPEGLREVHARERAAYQADPRTRPMGAGLELTGVRADGSEFPLEISLSPLEGQVETGTTIATIRDVTERLQARAASVREHRQSALAALGQLALTRRDEVDLVQEALRTASALLPAASVAMLDLAPDGASLAVTGRAGPDGPRAGDDPVPVAGSPEGVALREGLVLTGDAGADGHFPAAGPVVSCLAVAIALDGEPRRVLALTTPSRDAFSTDDLNFLQSVRNVLASALTRARAEARLETSTVWLQALLDNAPAAVYFKDVQGRFLVANDAAARIAGVEVQAMLGRSDEDLFDPATAAVFRDNDQRVLETGVPVEFAEHADAPDGGDRIYQSMKFPLRDREGRVFGVGGVSWEVTERIQAERERADLEQRRRHSERLEAVGQLAGGIAHDFNNLLGVIANYAGFLAGELPPGQQADDVLQIQQASRQAAELTRRLLQFSRRQPGHPQVLDVREVVAELERLLSRTLGDHIVVRTDVAPGLWTVTVDRGQLEQLLMNLALNARDAMPDGGELTLEAVNAERAAEPGEPTCRFVRLTVRDTGTGMTPEVRERAFEPFFTTRASGQGTGLGLASVYGIAAQAGGWVELDSEPDAGAAVTTWLPAGDGTAQAPGAVEPPAARGHGELLLLVEDQPAVREVTARILRGGGYDVEAVPGGEPALTWLAAAERRPAVLVTDMLMPVMSGAELAARMRETLPALPVVLVSGYTDRAPPDGDAGVPPTLFVEKPFSAARLLEAVARALEGGRAGGAGTHAGRTEAHRP
jgi:PAS domain S-box-containing protein